MWHLFQYCILVFHKIEDDTCSYKKLSNLVKDEGKEICLMTLKTQEDCEQFCDGISRCNSFTYEPNVKSCWLKEKEVTENDEFIDRDDYFTVYRSCEQGTKTLRIIENFIAFHL